VRDDDKENLKLSKKKPKSKSKSKRKLKKSPFDMQKCRKFIIQTYGKKAEDNKHAEERPVSDDEWQGT